ncbi:MAG: methyl-accepting chemotaxis protein [Sporomusaceae bacterium]|nr:methyl-accepting chemotaxis protein [Sporomusaceae bacterium]
MVDKPDGVAGKFRRFWRWRLRSFPVNGSALLTMTIGKKIAGSFIIVIALVCLSSVFTYIKIDQLHESAQATLQQALSRIQLAEELAIDVANEAVAMRSFNFTGDLSDAAAFADHRSFGDSKIRQLETELRTADALAILTELKTEKLAFDSLAEKSIAAKRAGDMQQVALYMQQAGKPSENSIALAKRLVIAVKDQIRNETENSARQAGQLKLLLVIVSLLVAVVAAAVSIYVSRGISLPLAALARTAQEIAAGNLTVADLSSRSNDELGTLAGGFNQMKNDLRTIIQQVVQAASQVATASASLTASAGQSAQAGSLMAEAGSSAAESVSLQIAAVEETALTVEKISANIQQAAANAGMADSKSEQAAAAAVDGSQAVERAVLQIQRLDQTVAAAAVKITELGARSREIEQIIAAISGIAAQTNLLALNAAIEAARAGEHGRGFSVVADEVRKLAEQSQTAAKKITGLISRIQEDTEQAVLAMNQGTGEVKAGVEMVNAAGGTFHTIQALSAEVSGQVKEIAASIQELACSSETMVAAMQSIDAAGQKVAAETQTVSTAIGEQAATVEEIAAASQTLAAMAQELKATAGSFRL